MAKVTNFQRVVAETMEAYNWTEVDLAKRIGITQPSLNRIRRGQTKEPRFTVGVKLVALWEDRPK